MMHTTHLHGAQDINKLRSRTRTGIQLWPTNRPTDSLSREILEKSIFRQLVKIFPCLWKLMVHCCVHKSPPPLPVLSQVDPLHSLPFYWRSFHYSPSIYAFILQVLTFFHVSLPKHCALLPQSCHIPFPLYPQFIHPNSVWWGVQIMKLLTCLASWNLISPCQNSGLLSDSQHHWTSRYQICLNAISHLLRCDRSDCEYLHQERFKCISECFSVEMPCSWLMWWSVCWGNSLLRGQNSNSDCCVCGCLMEPHLEGVLLWELENVLHYCSHNRWLTDTSTSSLLWNWQPLVVVSVAKEKL